MTRSKQTESYLQQLKEARYSSIDEALSAEQIGKLDKKKREALVVNIHSAHHKARMDGVEPSAEAKKAHEELGKWMDANPNKLHELKPAIERIAKKHYPERYKEIIHAKEERAANNRLKNAFRNFAKSLKEESEELDEAKAKSYVKKYMVDGEHVGYTSSDGYHKKFWRNSEHGLAKAKEHAKVDSITEEVEQIDELSRDTLRNYHYKAMTQLAPISAKHRKSETQITNRIRSGKTLKDYKPKDKLTPEEDNIRKNRTKGGSRAMSRINHLDGLYDGKKKESYKQYLTKEDVEQIDEQHKVGSYVHLKTQPKLDAPSGGKVVKVTDTHAIISPWPHKRMYRAKLDNLMSDAEYKKMLADKKKERLGEETINELSKELLRKYYDKASDDRYHRGRRIATTSPGSFNQKKAAAGVAKNTKRWNSMQLATAKTNDHNPALTKSAKVMATEELNVQINELSKGILSKYVSEVFSQKENIKKLNDRTKRQKANNEKKMNMMKGKGQDWVQVESMQINELSKELLGRYIKKAHTDVRQIRG